MLKNIIECVSIELQRILWYLSPLNWTKSYLVRFTFSSILKINVSPVFKQCLNFKKIFNNWYHSSISIKSTSVKVGMIHSNQFSQFDGKNNFDIGESRYRHHVNIKTCKHCRNEVWRTNQGCWNFQQVKDAKARCYQSIDSLAIWEDSRCKNG